MISTPRVEGTRERLLAIFRRSDGATVNDLATEVGLAGATVRRHLDVLLRDGHVAIRQAKGRTGRPRYVFSLTEAGADLFPHHYVRLTHRLLDEILSLDTSETQGRDGRALAGLVFERMAERLALEYGPRLRNGNLEERARRAATLLAEEGIDFEVIPAPGPASAAAAFHLVGRGCPCRRVGHDGHGAQGNESNGHTTIEAKNHSTHAGCEHDRRLLERLLSDRVTILTQDALPGDSLCGYRLDPTPAPPSTPLVPLA
ncbi:MAG: winged helix-turn-helix transcriptional regulator [Dehalococcoidia bacterium]|nr:winged helix-turn-helix transcriptional regulator [Dehalococcoidia bacterium]